MFAALYKSTGSDLLKAIIHTPFLAVLFTCNSIYANVEHGPKVAWYRYVDQNGIANISTSVTPAHIRYGYEALDSNMQVIKRTTSYNTEADLRQAPKRATQARQQAEDLKLKKAYSNAKVAQLKRNEALMSLTKQINFQQEQLKQLNNDRVLFKRQEADYLRKQQPVPVLLKQRLEYNAVNIAQSKQSISSLQSSYQQTQAYYEKIIARLNTLK